MIPPVAQTQFHCQVCGEVAATIELLPIDVINRPEMASGHEGTLILSGFLGRERLIIGETPTRAALQAALEHGNAQTLYNLDFLWAPFYCPECDAVYCTRHWTITPKFDDDFLGWFDCSYGLCPRGHRRLIED